MIKITCISTKVEVQLTKLIVIALLNIVVLCIFSFWCLDHQIHGLGIWSEEVRKEALQGGTIEVGLEQTLVESFSDRMGWLVRWFLFLPSTPLLDVVFLSYWV